MGRYDICSRYNLKSQTLSGHRRDGQISWGSVSQFGRSEDPNLMGSKTCSSQTNDLRNDTCHFLAIHVRKVWPSGWSGHGDGGLVSQWGSTIKSQWMHIDTSRYPSWHALKWCQDIKTPTTNQLLMSMCEDLALASTMLLGCKTPITKPLPTLGLFVLGFAEAINNASIFRSSNTIKAGRHPPKNHHRTFMVQRGQLIQRKKTN